MVRLGPLFPVPSWNGEAIGDHVILLLADQGHGDTLQFCRYVPQIAAGTRRTILAVQPSLVRLLSRLPGVSEIITQDVQPSSFDLWCGLMSLPHAVGTTLDTIPTTTPYLTADPADVAHWRKRLAGLAGLRVGLCWAGGRSPNVAKIAADRRRSITLDTLAPLGELSGVQFISLQKGPPAAEAARPPRGMQLHDFTEDLHDFADTAALIEGLDLVIHRPFAVAAIPAISTRRVARSIKNSTRNRCSPRRVQTSTVKKSAATTNSQCRLRNSFQVVFQLRSGTGSMPCRSRISAIVLRAILRPRLDKAP